MAYFYHNNLRMHYLDQGQGSPVLLLHGLGSCAQDWSQQIEALSGHHRVIALDLRGHGESETVSRPYQMKHLASDAMALMKSLELSAYQVVGFSLGGMVAFELALQAKTTLQAMVIINSGPQVAGMSRSLRWQLGLRLLVIKMLGMRRLGHLIGKKLFPLEGQQALRSRFEARMTAMDATSYKLALQAIAAFSVQQHIHLIQQPTLVISADQDYTPVSMKADYVQNMPNAVLEVIADSRHATPMDQPDKLNFILSQFLLAHEQVKKSHPSDKFSHHTSLQQ